MLPKYTLICTLGIFSLTRVELIQAHIASVTIFVCHILKEEYWVITNIPFHI